jgi:hypothetical protein
VVVYLPTNFEKDWPTLLSDCFAWFSHRQALEGKRHKKNFFYMFFLMYKYGCLYHGWYSAQAEQSVLQRNS